jgi:hypothetical protein
MLKGVLCGVAVEVRCCLLVRTVGEVGTTNGLYACWKITPATLFINKTIPSHTTIPVRSALYKQCTGGLVIRWVTTSESPLLYVFVFFCLLEDLANLLK